MLKVIDTIWKTGGIVGGTIIGIVAVRGEDFDDTDQWCAYIGVAPGVDVETDVRYVIDWGVKLNKREAMGFFPDLNEEEYEQ